jgi:hypothetical protein
MVNSNFNESPEEVREHARSVGFDFPVYKDVNNVVVDLFGAFGCSIKRVSGFPFKYYQYP